MNSLTFSNHTQSAAAAPESPAPFEILCLNREDDAARSGSTHRPVLWISSQPPQALVGILGHEIEGAWSEPGKIVVSLDGRTLVYQTTPPPAAELHALLKKTLELHLAGVSPNAIQNTLAPANLQPAFA